MHSVKSLFILIILTSPLYFNFQVKAQKEIQKEVRVVKPYSPTLSEANKISLLPVFNDTSRITPDFAYVIYPKRFETDYKIDPIKPAKMVGMPISKLYKSQLTLGAGNYKTPYLELAINQLRAKTTQLGFYFNHQSSTGKLKLDNEKKVDAGYNDNKMKLYGKKIFESSVLEADISGGYNSVNYYGYDPLIDTILDKNDHMQKILSANGGIKYYSMNVDSSHLNYTTGFNYGVVNDYSDNTEQNIDFNIGLNKKYNDQVFGGEMRIRYFGRSGGVDSSSTTIVDVNPWYAKNKEEWKFQVGLNFNYDEGQEVIHLYPMASFEFNIVPKVLVPYFGLSGYNEISNYGKILFENNYFAPAKRTFNSNHPIVLFAGLKGQYSNKISFNLKGSYEKIDNMYFFRNDSSDVLRNKFIVEYDNISLMSLGGEVSWHQSGKLQFLAKAKYFDYQLDKLEHAWHLPSFVASIAADYNLRDKILVGTDVFYTGKRYAPGTGGNINELKGYLDANLSIEYRYTKPLSFFLRINNLTASRYEIWNQYPAQRFQFLAGFSYAL
jgi:hypothetical protein